MDNQEACQREGEGMCSRLSRPRPVILFQFLLEHLYRRGWGATTREVVWYFCRRLGQARRPAAVVPGRPVRTESLGLQPGELVEVKSRREILTALDQYGRSKGLLLIPEMLEFCGRRFRVHKRVERIFLEESKQLRRVKNTVLLEGVMCGGAAMRCDKSCFYYWREEWLRRVPGDMDPESRAGQD